MIRIRPSMKKKWIQFRPSSRWTPPIRFRPKTFITKVNKIDVYHNLNITWSIQIYFTVIYEKIRPESGSDLLPNTDIMDFCQIRIHVRPLLYIRIRIRLLFMIQIRLLYQIWIRIRPKDPDPRNPSRYKAPSFRIFVFSPLWYMKTELLPSSIKSTKSQKFILGNSIFSALMDWISFKYSVISEFCFESDTACPRSLV